jgi:hypothetical protein
MTKELFNPKHEEALRRDPTLGTPLFDGEKPRPVPPATVTVSETRKAAYVDTRDSGRMRGMQTRIVKLLEARGALTRQEISDITHIPVHVVSARICELHDQLGEIEIASTEENPTGKKFNPVTRKYNTAYRVKK